MTKVCESREKMDAFNPNLHLPPINLENTYKISSLLFSLKISQVLECILNFQRSPLDKAYIEYISEASCEEDSNAKSVPSCWKRRMKKRPIIMHTLSKEEIMVNNSQRGMNT
jgi:hypothetical protein